jgi:hypothetical protein
MLAKQVAPGSEVKDVAADGSSMETFFMLEEVLHQCNSPTLKQMSLQDFNRI